ncbi:hypothetical protein PHYPSEUDO_013157 [Phytophthora pseudosyringae]|uniref:Crinkler (CRN) family protein n=1 Tax=Phytophthora pseudosyringae TaxID=221518 RepID=A0A8T1V6H7_9STRA|nr:hypothetical protein PHYPSEUDO_013157 [Phytophthora pseudosyringae]
MARKWFQLVGEDGRTLTSASSVSVDIEDVDAFRDAVKLKCPNALAKVDAADLTVFANREAYDAKQKLPKSSSSVTDSGKDKDDALIVQVPDVNDGSLSCSVGGVSAKVQQDKLLNSLEWKGPKRLCGSTGQDWPYQGAAELGARLADPLAQHYDAWQKGNQDKQNHALFLVLSGPGTGKSRMLDEMQGLLCEAAELSDDRELASKMKKAYRMLYQLARERNPWMAFVDQLKDSCPSLRLRIESVIDIVAKLEKIDNVKDMTVILCVDGLQKLVLDKTKTSDFYRVLTAICRFLNSSRAFVVCVCSATVQKPLSEALVGSTQKRVFLLPPPLHGHDIIAPRTRMEKQLVDDMGGHGRALEALQKVLDDRRKKVLEDFDPATIVEQRCRRDALEEVDPATIVDDVYAVLQENYGEVFDSALLAESKNCQEVLAAILSRRRYGVLERIGRTSVTVDELRSFGLFRWTPDQRLECAFILLVVLMRKLPKKVGEVDNFDEHITRSVLLWQQFEHFVAFYRRVKSIAFCGIPVALSEFHAGARFGEIDGICIKEPSPRTVVKAINQHDTKSVSDGSACFTNLDGDVKLFEMKTIVINGDSASAGDLFMRVRLIVGNEQVQCIEVIQCKLLQTKQKMSKATYEKEKAKGMKGSSDVFLLITSAELADCFTLPPRCGIVSKDEFVQYFGPFASRAYRSLLQPPNINTASYFQLCLIKGVDDATAKAIMHERKERGRFLSHEDAVSRLQLSKKPKTAEVLGALLYDGEGQEVEV